MKRFLASLTLVLFVSMGLFGIMSGNDSELAYGEGGTIEGSELRGGSPVIRTLVIEGAGHFLKSHSDFQLFLNKIELSGLSSPNYEELQGILNAAVTGMEAARTTYFNLKNTAAGTPYNQEVIEKLTAFDYFAFLAGQNLNRQILKEVESFLKEGDVNGIYNRFFLNTGKILENLYTIQNQINSGVFPDVRNLWKLNQKYSDSQLFGQYVTMIFHKLKGGRE